MVGATKCGYTDFPDSISDEDRARIDDPNKETEVHVNRLQRKRAEDENLKTARSGA